MSRLQYVFAWRSGESFNCKTAENGEFWQIKDELSLELGDKERWFRVFTRIRTGNVVTLFLVPLSEMSAIDSKLMTNAVAEFLLHLEGVKNDA